MSASICTCGWRQASKMIGPPRALRFRRLVDVAAAAAAIAEGSPDALVVDEADDLVAELRGAQMILSANQAVRARPRPADSGPLEADPGAPPQPALAHELPRGESQRDVRYEEDGPDRLRHLERARCAPRVRSRSAP